MVDRLRRFFERSREIHNNYYDYSLIKEYKNAHTHVEIICPKHGVFRQLPLSHVNHRAGCKKCHDENNSYKFRMGVDEFIRRSSLLHNNYYDYSLITQYTNAHTKVPIICSIHGIFWQSPAKHLRKQGCKWCNYGRPKLILNDFLKRSKEIHSNKYSYELVTVITSYRHFKIKIICKKHGIFEQSPENHLQGYGCSICKSSRGELRIIKILKKMDIEFLYQHKFKDLFYKKPLVFDFFLPKENILIEYDGEFHFRNIFRDERSLKSQLERDLMKDEYARKNEFKLLRIPFWEFDNIEQALKENITIS